jgi:hypothetical protein
MKTWKTIVSAIAVAGCAVAFVPREAEALPANEVYRFYYSNASMTNQVGEKWVTSCYGVVNILEGSTSQYYTTLSTSCSSGTTSGGCYSHGAPISCPATICQQVPEFCN